MKNPVYEFDDPVAERAIKALGKSLGDFQTEEDQFRAYVSADSATKIYRLNALTGSPSNDQLQRAYRIHTQILDCFIGPFLPESWPEKFQGNIAERRRLIEEALNDRGETVYFIDD